MVQIVVVGHPLVPILVVARCNVLAAVVVQLQILTAIVKLFLKSPQVAQASVRGAVRSVHKAGR